MRAGKAPVTQQVGRAAWNAGIEAIKIRSAADSAGQNLVVFVDNVLRSSSLAMITPDRLHGI